MRAAWKLLTLISVVGRDSCDISRIILFFELIALRWSTSLHIFFWSIILSVHSIPFRVPFPHCGSHPDTPEDQTQAGCRGQEADFPVREENSIEERQSIVSISSQSTEITSLIFHQAQLTSPFSFSWYKDNELLEFSHPNYITLKDDHITIVANAINEGTYTCIVKKKDKVLTNYSWRVRVRF